MHEFYFISCAKLRTLCYGVIFYCNSTLGLFLPNFCSTKLMAVIYVFYDMMWARFANRKLVFYKGQSTKGVAQAAAKQTYFSSQIDGSMKILFCS